ncbi:MAG: CRISPR-associated endonuclease Cas2 [Oscillospiraceae bacterium]|jgi:CRISPR-associated endonuclease Cas2|nr:CRISPR-associated endonuclease Cas2 [Oscillospiraceae bacterium]
MKKSIVALLYLLFLVFFVLITSNKLRRKIEKALKNFGQRMQKSVFLCTLGAEKLTSLSNVLQRLLERLSDLQESSDSVVVTGPLHEKNVNYLLGNPCILEDYVIY